MGTRGAGFGWCPNELPGKHPAPRSEPSTAGKRAGAGGALVCRAGGGKGRELLLDALPSALGALRRLLLACQDELLEDVSAVGTGILEDRHGKLSVLSQKLAD